MNIIKLSRQDKRYIKIMMKYNLDGYNYIRIKKSGLVVLKPHWYSFKRIVTTTNDIVLFSLPTMLSENVSKDSAERTLYMNQFGDALSLLLTNTFSYKQSAIDYLWEFYNKTCIDIPDLFVTHQNSYRKLLNKMFSFKTPKTYHFLDVIEPLKVKSSQSNSCGVTS